MPRYFAFHVVLRGVEPPIWRRFLIAYTARFVDLHEAIQDACGWNNSHLFAFRNSKGRVIAELPGDEFDKTGPDAMTTKVSSYLGEGKRIRCVYAYDFGDGWEHDLTLEEVVTLPDKFGRHLLSGSRAFPPEDCGGIGGYEECVEVALGRKKDKERLAWLEGWQPEAFDYDQAEAFFYQAKLSLRAHYDADL